MYSKIGSVEPSGKIFSSGDIELPSPFDAIGSVLDAQYERVAHCHHYGNVKQHGTPVLLLARPITTLAPK